MARKMTGKERRQKRRQKRRGRKAGGAIGRGIGSRIAEGGIMRRIGERMTTRQKARQKRRQTRITGRVKKRQTRMDAKAAGTGKWSQEAIAGRQELLGKTLGAAGAAAGAIGSLLPGKGGDALEGIGGAFGDAFGPDDAPIGDYSTGELGPAYNWPVIGGIAAAVVLVLILIFLSMKKK